MSYEVSEVLQTDRQLSGGNVLPRTLEQSYRGTVLHPSPHLFYVQWDGSPPVQLYKTGRIMLVKMTSDVIGVVLCRAFR